MSLPPAAPPASLTGAIQHRAGIRRTALALVAVGLPGIPTEAGAVFHAWYVSRLENDAADVARKSAGKVSPALHFDPLVARLRSACGLDH